LLQLRKREEIYQARGREYRAPALKEISHATS
jgi:hypothetical protein